MKLKTLLLIVICLLYGYYFSFSQATKPGLHEMIIALDKTTVHSQRADIYFNISKNYADKLKVY
jgi:hypothetical protein